MTNEKFADQIGEELVPQRRIHRNRIRLANIVEEDRAEFTDGNCDEQSDLVKLKQEVEFLRSQLKDSKSEFQDFSAKLSHDLKSPLRAITGFSQFLQEEYHDRIDSDGNEYISKMLQATHRMRGKIDRLRTYSRALAQVNPDEIVDLGDALSVACCDVQELIDANDAEIKYSQLPMVWGDRKHLVVVLSSLLRNSLVYRGKNAPQIHVDARRSSNGWVVSVTDNGVGIRPQDSSKIFSVFCRLNNVKDSQGGVELATCRRILEGHGGKIWLEESGDTGSQFRFTLPDVPTSAMAEPIEKIAPTVSMQTGSVAGVFA